MYIAAAASAGDPRPLRVLHTGETPGPLPASPGLTSISYTSIDSTSLSLSMGPQADYSESEVHRHVTVTVTMTPSQPASGSEPEPEAHW